jgi:purine nucleosidase
MKKKFLQHSRVKLLLDTDIGSDIDDAVALAYLLAQPRCHLLGITTVTGEAEKRAGLCSALCKIAQKDIPIVPGTEKPFLIEQQQPMARQAKSLVRWPHRKKFENIDAVHFLRDTIRRHPGEITLLTIGPLTNIGLLFALDPQIPLLLKSLVLMCGYFASPHAACRSLEWNAKLDPHAAAIVYRAPVKRHRSLGLDVTLRVQLKKEEVAKRFTHPLLVPVLDFAQHWFKMTEVMTFHDPLAAVSIFDPQVCSFTKGQVTVETYNQKLLGRTIWDTKAKTKPHEVALQVDAQRFFKKYFEVFE